MSVSDQAPDSSSAQPQRQKLGINPYREYQLCKDLAVGEKTRAQLAREHGVNRSAITLFAQRHKARIEEIQAHLDDEFAGLWAARKEARIAAYQREIDRLDDHPHANHHEWSKARQAALRAIADELGQMPARGLSVTGQVTHVLEGVAIEELT